MNENDNLTLLYRSQYQTFRRGFYDTTSPSACFQMPHSSIVLPPWDVCNIPLTHNI